MYFQPYLFGIAVQLRRHARRICFACASGRCLTYEFLCDGITQLPGGDDELECCESHLTLTFSRIP